MNALRFALSGREHCTCRTVRLRVDVGMLCICGIGLGTMDWDSTCTPPSTRTHVIVVDVVIHVLLFARPQIFRENRVEWRCRNRFGNAEYSMALSHVGGVGR